MILLLARTSVVKSDRDLKQQFIPIVTFDVDVANDPQHPNPVQFVSNLFLPGGFELAKYADSKVVKVISVLKRCHHCHQQFIINIIGF